MKKPIDLNKLKEEIDNRKKQKDNPTISPSHLGENKIHGNTPKDKFLNGLISSLQSGIESPSTKLIKSVDSTTSQKKGEPVNENYLQENKNIPKPQPQVNMSPERDEEMYKNFENQNKKTLAESIGGYVKQPQNNYQQQQLQYPQQPLQNPQQANTDGVLVENIKKMVDSHLVENFSVIVEDTIKSTILEMYAVERIKDVLHENRELIKEVVYETIREIKAKSKAR